MQSKLFALSLLFTIANAVDYCKLCTNHVACNNNNKFNSNCSSDAKLVPMTSSAIQTFLNTHNELRNKIAGGSQRGFESAKKMMKLVKKIFKF